jgi:hypothetical protein
MPHYFFTQNFLLKDVRDSDGFEAANLATAVGEAREAIRAIATQHLSSGTPLTLTGITICDHEGLILARVTLQEALDEVQP